jgi:predicted  nucleic acid-binding Zn-ribbon protein
VQQDEHRGLAGRILELRNTIEEQRLAGIQERSQLGQRMAQLEQQVSAMGVRVDREVEAIQKTQQQLGNLLREGGEQVRVTGELSRKMTDQVKVLEELREMASDPHEVVKPLQKSLALLRGDLEALSKTIDVRFEQMPKNRSQPLESRGEDEQPLVKMGAEIRKLKERVTELETG